MPAPTFDMGDEGCGEMAMSLRKEMLALTAGDEVRVLSRDAGAPEDVPAWCRLTGHTLVTSRTLPDGRTHEFILRKGRENGK